MPSRISKQDAEKLKRYMTEREGALLSAVRALVEAESPSGDEEGSRAAVKLLADAARAIGAVSSVERIPVPAYGEHLRIRAFADERETREKLLLVGHTDTVHPRGTILLRPWRETASEFMGRASLI